MVLKLICTGCGVQASLMLFCTVLPNEEITSCGYPADITPILSRQGIHMAQDVGQNFKGPSMMKSY